MDRVRFAPQNEATSRYLNGLPNHLAIQQIFLGSNYLEKFFRLIHFIFKELERYDKEG